MLTASLPPHETVESLKGLIGWFNQNSAELIEEYRRLEASVAHLQAQLEVKNQELQKSLQAREQARSYLLSVLESLKGGVLVLDGDLQPTFVNRRLVDLAGEIDGARVGQFLGARLAASLRQGEKNILPLECEKIVQRPDGDRVPVHFTISEVAAGPGKCHYVLVFQDITALKRQEAEAARTRRLASLGIMASEVAHQVKNPLGGIELCASILKEKSKGEVKRLAAEIAGAVQRLSTTLSQLLAFAAEPTVASDRLSVASLTQDLLQECAPLFDDPASCIVVDIAADLPPVWGDRGLLVQALLNLIVNAKEAMPAGGRVGLSARLSPFSTLDGQLHKTVQIIVRDDGAGIAPENRERIFDPFFTTKRQGTGLGLAFTHKIISAHRGSIEIDSTPGRGSQFTVCLAAAEELRATC